MRPAARLRRKWNQDSTFHIPRLKREWSLGTTFGRYPYDVRNAIVAPLLRVELSLLTCTCSFGEWLPKCENFPRGDAYGERDRKGPAACSVPWCLPAAGSRAGGGCDHLQRLDGR